MNNNSSLSRKIMQIILSVVLILLNFALIFFVSGNILFGVGMGGGWTFTDFFIIAVTVIFSINTLFHVVIFARKNPKRNKILLIQIFILFFLLISWDLIWNIEAKIRGIEILNPLF